MRKAVVGMVIVSFAAMPLMTTGCETAGGSAGTGAAAGAAVGGLIGAGSGNVLEGALIGAAAGALAGWIIYDVKARKSKEATATAAEYNWEPQQGTVLQLESADVIPQVVQRGNVAEATIQYALLGTGAGTEVVETRTLQRGSEIIGTLSQKSYTRNDGTWVSSQQFKVASNLAPGTYTLVQTVQSPTQTINSTTDFIVQ